MNPAILQAGMYFGFLVCATGACLYLFYTVKLDCRAIERQLQAQGTKWRESVDQLRAELQSLRETVDQSARLPARRAPSFGINLNQRTQVLRMSRRGESVSSIAAALGCAQNEVELLLKIHQTILAREHASGGETVADSASLAASGSTSRGRDLQSPQLS